MRDISLASFEQVDQILAYMRTFGIYPIRHKLATGVLYGSKARNAAATDSSGHR